MVKDWAGPTCKCGSRNTERRGSSALLRQCHSCGNTYAYRIHHGHIVPYALVLGLLLDEWRKSSRGKERKAIA